MCPNLLESMRQNWPVDLFQLILSIRMPSKQGPIHHKWWIAQWDSHLWSSVSFIMSSENSNTTSAIHLPSKLNIPYLPQVSSSLLSIHLLLMTRIWFILRPTGKLLYATIPTPQITGSPWWPAEEAGEASEAAPRTNVRATTYHIHLSLPKKTTATIDTGRGVTIYKTPNAK